jgi:hypothetical protein
MASEPDGIETVEEGDIFFLYRPKVNEDEPSDADDMQRFFVVLRPRGGKTVRLMVAGRKHLPDVSGHERVWGYVDLVAAEGQEIEKALREETYDTKTRGEQTAPAARPAGEGVYAIVLEDGRMHLAYALELPERPGKVQRAFNIAPKAAFALSVKNPEKGQPKNAGLSEDRKADYPDRLQAVFRDRRFATEDVRLLDHEGAEFLLVGARRDPQTAYGVSLAAEDEAGDPDRADIFTKLRMAKSRHPVEPLLSGVFR